MRAPFKLLRPWLQSWGDWRRSTLVIGYPTQAISCNPDLHIAKPFSEPAFKKENELLLRQFHHIKRQATKPKRKGTVPNYDPLWRMNLIDRCIMELETESKQIIFLRYYNELKVKEIVQVIHRSEDTVHKRIAKAHRALSNIPDLMVSRGAPIAERHKAKNCNNAA